MGHRPLIKLRSFFAFFKVNLAEHINEKSLETTDREIFLGGKADKDRLRWFVSFISLHSSFYLV